MGSSSQFVCKVTKPRNKHKVQSQKLFVSSKFIRTIRHTSRRLAPKTRLLSRKNRDILNKTPLLYSPTPHPTALPTRPRPLQPLYARIRALSEFSFFAFTLHHPRYLTHSLRVRGEGNALKCLHPTKKFPAHSKRAKKQRERRPLFPLVAAFTLMFTLNALYINPMQSIYFVF